MLPHLPHPAYLLLNWCMAERWELSSTFSLPLWHHVMKKGVAECHSTNPKRNSNVTHNGERALLHSEREKMYTCEHLCMCEKVARNSLHPSWSKSKWVLAPTSWKMATLGLPFGPSSRWTAQSPSPTNNWYQKGQLIIGIHKELKTTLPEHTCHPAGSKTMRLNSTKTKDQQKCCSLRLQLFLLMWSNHSYCEITDVHTVK